MTAEQKWVADFIAAIPDLTSHRFMDTDGEFSVKIHNEHEVAERVCQAFSKSGLIVVNYRG